jgi:hypothetical protein
MSEEAGPDIPKTRVEQAEYVVKRLAELGVTINPSSRIGRMLRVLRRPERIMPDDPDYSLAIESIRDMYQLRLIVDTVGAHRNDLEFRKAVNILKKDLAFPEEGEQSPGRNYQFQLYLAALCTNAGHPTRHDEPDVQFDFEGATFGIAAKRLRTFSSLEEHLKDGADQLRRAGYPGLIALDLTIAWNPTNQRLQSPLQAQLYGYVFSAKVRTFVADYGDKIRSFVAGKGVLSILLFESILRVTPEPNWTQDLWTFWLPTTENETREILLRKLQRGFLSGVPNLVDMTEPGPNARPRS